MQLSIRSKWLGRACASLILASGVLAAPLAAAGWNGSEESIAQHPTWIYTPSSTLANGKRALMLVLHGCAQTNDQLKTAGNLTGAAEAHGFVLAVPDVGSKAYGPGCWDYDGATDAKGHIAELVNLANTLRARGSLNIDPNHVYITGLSSGGAIAQAVGCKAPDVFAGVASVAGPSVGSSQMMATQNAPGTAAQTHIQKCNQLAGSKSSHFATQIANLAYGDMDKNGSAACVGLCNTPGKKPLVDVAWATHSANAMRSIYGTGALGSAAQVPGGGGDHRHASKDGKARVALLQVYSVGHAWPAGGGPGSGDWIAPFGLDYTNYLADWFVKNNVRDGGGGGDAPALSVNGNVSGTTIHVSGSASDSDGSIASIGSVLLRKSGSNWVQQASHSNLGTGPNYSDSYTGLADGMYRVEVTAIDNDSKSTTRSTIELNVGTAAVSCTNYSATNYAHLGAGRATYSLGYVYAKGSNELMGLMNLQVTVLREYSNQPGYYRVGACD